MNTASVSTAAGIITQTQFVEYSEKWLSIAGDASGTALPACFLDAKQERIKFVSFPVDQIVSLISTVGIRQVKARFILVPDSKGGYHFSLALYASDGTVNEDDRLSAYYVADPGWTGNALGQVVGGPVPHSLAALWLTQWQEAAITPDLFVASTGATLQGYNFEADDFVTALFNSQPIDGQAIRLGLGVHEFYGPNDDVTPTQTFGLVLRLYKPGTTTSAEPFFDMAAPCPPNQ
jgi:hypothetical protein